jgi:hypothetical protein
MEFVAPPDIVGAFFCAQQLTPKKQCACCVAFPMVGRAGEVRSVRQLFSAKIFSVAGVLSLALLITSAANAETRGYAVSWFYAAAYSEDGDCPDGLNPSADKMVLGFLKQLGKSQQEIDALMVNFPNEPKLHPAITFRGQDNGKPANAYLHPTLAPDTKIKTWNGHHAFGFNLDGKVKPDDPIDPETNETGIDNQLVRAVGCFPAHRAIPPARPSWPEIEWASARDQVPAWLIEIEGLQSDKAGKVADGDVHVGFYLATMPAVRNSASETQADMSFTVDDNPRFQNRVHATIKNGVLTTDPFEFDLTQDPMVGVAEYQFKNTRVRLKFKPDGSIEGVLGGYQPWLMLYDSYAIGGWVTEVNVSLDVVGIYYALKKFADAYPDDAGQNQYISSAYMIQAVPAFVNHKKETQRTAGLPLKLSDAGK